MKVLLLKAVPKVGKKDEIVTVADGYFQNVLLPKKLAVVATDQAVAALRRTQQNTAAKKEVQHALLDKALAVLKGEPLVYKVKKNEKGSLFSRVTEHDISHALQVQHNVSIDAKFLSIEGSDIKQTGIFVVEVHDGEYRNTFTVKVV